MGIRKSVFNALGGFSGLKVSEDIDLSIRLYKKGYRTGLIEEAYVFHKRRSTFYKFFRQVFSFGSGRIDLQLRHGDALKPVHMLPSLFVLYLLAGLGAGIFSKGIFMLWSGSVMAYMIAILYDATVQNRSLVVGMMSVYAALVMLSGYGLGMLKAAIMRFVFGSKKKAKNPISLKNPDRIGRCPAKFYWNSKKNGQIHEAARWLVCAVKIHPQGSFSSS